MKHSILRLYVDASERYVRFLVDDRGDIRHNAYVIVAYDLDDGGELRPLLARPACGNQTIRIAVADIQCIRAVCAMYLDDALRRDEPEDVVAIDWAAAFRELVVDAGDILAYDYDILCVRRLLAVA